MEPQNLLPGEVGFGTDVNLNTPANASDLFTQVPANTSQDQATVDNARITDKIQGAVALAIDDFLSGLKQDKARNDQTTLALSNPTAALPGKVSNWISIHLTAVMIFIGIIVIASVFGFTRR